MEDRDLQKKIEIMRKELYDLIDKYGIDSNTVLEYSQKLDKILCEFIKKKNSIEFSSVFK